MCYHRMQKQTKRKSFALSSKSFHCQWLQEINLVQFSVVKTDFFPWFFPSSCRLTVFISAGSWIFFAQTRIFLGTILWIRVFCDRGILFGTLWNFQLDSNIWSFSVECITITTSISHHFSFLMKDASSRSLQKCSNNHSHSIWTVENMNEFFAQFAGVFEIARG